MTYLQGKRTYIISIGAIVAALVAFLTGELSAAEAINSAALGAGLATLRMAK